MTSRTKKPPRNEPTSLVTRLDDYWFGPVSAWPLAAFRILFAVALLCYFSDRIFYLEEFLGPSPGRLPDLGVTDDSPLRFHQPLYVEPLSQSMRMAVAAVFYLLGISLVVGFRARWAAGLLAGWVASVTLVDWMGAFSFNRSAVLILAMMATMPLSAVWSVDAYRESRRRRSTPGEPAPSPLPAKEVQISAWPVRTLQWFFLLWFVLAGLVKLKADWSLFGVNDILWSQLQGWYQNDLCWWAITHIPKPFFGAAELATLYFEVFAPLWLLPRRVRPWGMVVGICLHIMIAVLMTKLWVFSAEMLSFYVLFLPIPRAGGARES